MRKKTIAKAERGEEKEGSEDMERKKPHGKRELELRKLDEDNPQALAPLAAVR